MLKIHKEIAQYLLDNPKAYIYYHDNGGWVIYSEKPRENASYKKLKELQVYEGWDYNNINGYVPTLVEIMAIALNRKVYSI